MWHGIWCVLTTRFQDSNAPTQSPYPCLTTLAWLTKPISSLTSHISTPEPKALTPFFFFSLAPCLPLRIPTSPQLLRLAHRNNHSLGPISPPLTGKVTLILLGEPPFSSPHNVPSNPKGHHRPCHSVSQGSTRRKTPFSNLSLVIKSVFRNYFW